MPLPLSLKLADWPAIDQQLWNAARNPMRFDASARIANSWGERRCRIVCQSYGQWLSWLARIGELDPDLHPAQRATVERLEAFITQLRERVSSQSACMMVQALQRMFLVMAPKAEWSWLAVVVANLKRLARPCRDKRSHMVDPTEIYDLGLALMEEARKECELGKYHAATKGRDGMILALLISCPVRMANLASIEIGRHLVTSRETYALRFTEEETKTGKPIDMELPPALRPWVEFYLKVHRKSLVSRGHGTPTRALWISRWGEPMIEHALRDQIRIRTATAFGRHVWPHLFRAIAATGFVDHAPAKTSLLPDLLNHGNVQTSKRYYVLSSGAAAHTTVQNAFLTRRKQARERLKNGGGRP